MLPQHLDPRVEDCRVIPSELKGMAENAGTERGDRRDVFFETEEWGFRFN